MKKEIIILWLASFVIVFLAVYISNIIDEDYPITSTFGIDGKKVSYRFEKVHYGNEDFKVIIRTDVPELTGTLYWKSKTDSDWRLLKLKQSELILSADIPVLKPTQKIDYYIELHHRNKTFIIPENQKVSLTFFGKIPVVVNFLEFLLLYFGLVAAVRTGLEFFNNGLKAKAFGFVTLIIFLTLIALINPLYLTYKYGYMNSSIPPIGNLFLVSDLVIFILWIITVVAVFKSNRFKVTPLFSAVITLIIFILFR
jgi:hypothetical protein